MMAGQAKITPQMFHKVYNKNVVNRYDSPYKQRIDQIKFDVEREKSEIQKLKDAMRLKNQYK